MPVRFFGRIVVRQYARMSCSLIRRLSSAQQSVVSRPNSCSKRSKQMPGPSWSFNLAHRFVSE